MSAIFGIAEDVEPDADVDAAANNGLEPIAKCKLLKLVMAGQLLASAFVIIERNMLLYYVVARLLFTYFTISFTYQYKRCT